jgi:hypothetical protein
MMFPLRHTIRAIHPGNATHSATAGDRRRPALAEPAKLVCLPVPVREWITPDLLMKQPAFFFVIFAANYLFLNDLRLRLGLKGTLLQEQGVASFSNRCVE